MRIIDVVHQLLPTGVSLGLGLVASPSRKECPTWPPDIFAVVGSIIDRSGCYTEASPNRSELAKHEDYLDEVAATVEAWTNLLHVPHSLQLLWEELVTTHAGVRLDELNDNPAAQQSLFKLLAISDEASQSLGWYDDPAKASDFQTAVFINTLTSRAKDVYPLPYWPTSLCRMVSPDQVVVLPKSITTDKGCTFRSLSHNLALLPCRTVLKPEWRIVSPGIGHSTPTDLHLLLVPFPYEIPKSSFELTSPRQAMRNGTTHAAFFKLRQNWLLKPDGTQLSAEEFARELILPLIEEAKVRSGGRAPDGVILPECALNESITIDLIQILKAEGVEFLITGVLDDDDPGRRPLNKAYTVFLNKELAAAAPQNKHHRWRVDQPQADSYGLHFDDSGNQQWWEDIDVSKRGLPFYAFRQDTSLVTLICEDLARMEPAMNAIRAVGPNLVVALLMDGPQLGSRWPARYASVLADEPGCSVLSLTCAATVELSNTHFRASKVAAGEDEPKTRCVIGRWTQARGLDPVDIVLAPDSKGVLLTLKSQARHQTTLDNRSDKSQSRELVFVAQQSLAVGQGVQQPA